VSAKRFAKPERPRLRRRGKPARQWLILEPARVGAVGGALCALLTLVVNFVRHLAGSPAAPGSVIVAAALTFVVGYTLVGIFVWYLLWVAEQEWPEETATQSARLGMRGESAQDAPVDAPPGSAPDHAPDVEE
jgi:hypothetical protein